MLSRRYFLYATGGTAAANGLLATPGIASEAHGAAAERSSAIGAAAALAAKQYVVKPEINPDLRAHGAIFEQKIHKVGDNVYSAVGWSICNTIMVVGSQGVVIVDTGTDIQSAREVAAEFRKITDKPVVAV